MLVSLYVPFMPQRARAKAAPIVTEASAKSLNLAQGLPTPTKAWQQYHKGYWKNFGKMFAGVSLSMAGLYVAYRGIPGGGKGGGIGISAMRRSQGFEGAMATGKAGVQAGISLGVLGSLLIGSSFKGIEDTSSNVMNAVNKCKSQFPNANHALAGFSL
jgi:hypothetical protein